MLGNDKLRHLRQTAGLRQIDIAAYTDKSLRWIKMIEACQVDPGQEVHDKWVECCFLKVRTTKKRSDFGG
jgi:predicted transcriptional regulator